MENCTELSNCSLSRLTEASLAGPYFGGFLLVILTILSIIFAAIVITIATLSTARGVAKILRVYLINLLAAGLLLVIFGIAIILLAVILNFTDVSLPDLGVCRFLQWGYIVSATVRLYSLAAFSVAVLMIVKWNKRTLKLRYLVLSVTVIWSASILLNVHIITPPVFAVQYYDSVACFPKTLNADIIKELRYTFTTISVLLGGVLPLSISILVPVVILCYIKRNTCVEESAYKKAIARFTLFLVIGNGINLLGQTLLGLIVYYSEVPGVYLAYATGVISVTPTPIMVILFLKKKLCQSTTTRE